MNIPTWATYEWWAEHPENSKEWWKRYHDFLAMYKENGIPVIIMDGKQEAVGVEFANKKNCETTKKVGGFEQGEPRIVCRWCGEDKELFKEYLRELDGLKKGEQSKIVQRLKDALIRVVDPMRLNTGLVGSPYSGWVWAKCPHIKAWREEYGVARPKRRNLKFGE